MFSKLLNFLLIFLKISISLLAKNSRNEKKTQFITPVLKYTLFFLLLFSGSILTEKKKLCLDKVILKKKFLTLLKKIKLEYFCLSSEIKAYNSEYICEYSIYVSFFKKFKYLLYI